MPGQVVRYFAVISSIQGVRDGLVTYSFGPPPGSSDRGSALWTRSTAARRVVAYPSRLPTCSARNRTSPSTLTICTTPYGFCRVSISTHTPGSGSTAASSGCHRGGSSLGMQASVPAGSDMTAPCSDRGGSRWPLPYSVYWEGVSCAQERNVCGRRQDHWMTPADLLAFEQANPGWSSAKEMRIRHELGVTPPRYIVLLERAAAGIEGQIADPVTAHRVTSFTPARRRAEATRPGVSPHVRPTDVGKVWARSSSRA